MNPALFGADLAGLLCYVLFTLIALACCAMALRRGRTTGYFPHELDRRDWRRLTMGACGCALVSLAYFVLALFVGGTAHAQEAAPATVPPTALPVAQGEDAWAWLANQVVIPLVVHYPKVGVLLTALVSLRLVLKPLHTWLEQGLSGNQKAVAELHLVEASGWYKGVSFALDLLCSIKLPVLAGAAAPAGAQPGPTQPGSGGAGPRSGFAQVKLLGCVAALSLLGSLSFTYTACTTHSAAADSGAIYNALSTGNAVEDAALNGWHVYWGARWRANEGAKASAEYSKTRASLVAEARQVAQVVSEAKAAEDAAVLGTRALIAAAAAASATNGPPPDFSTVAVDATAAGAKLLSLLATLSPSTTTTNTP